MSVRRAVLGVASFLVLVIGLAAGLDAGSASAGHVADTTATTTTVATVPEPVVTTVAVTTTTPAAPPGKGKPLIRLGTMNTPEQAIIGELYQKALEREGYKVYLTENASSPTANLVGLHDGTIDLFPEYLGIWNGTLAHLHRRFRTLQESLAAARSYARAKGYVLLAPTPFSDTSCVAVLTQYARTHHIYSIPELARDKRLTFGAPLSFQTSADGLPALERSYHLHPQAIQNVDDGWQYGRLRSGNVQATYCSTTDPSLAGGRYLALRDPKHVFGHGNIVAVTSSQILSEEGPAFTHTIQRIDALLTLRAMRGLDAEAELGGHEFDQIAKQFLEGNGILPRSAYAPVPTTTSQSK